MVGAATLPGERVCFPYPLVYGCPDCGHEWRRHACRNGHVLLKYGALTPHRRLDDADGNVVCSVCGHYLRGRSW